MPKRCLGLMLFFLHAQLSGCLIIKKGLNGDWELDYYYELVISALA